MTARSGPRANPRPAVPGGRAPGEASPRFAPPAASGASADHPAAPRATRRPVLWRGPAVPPREAFTPKEWAIIRSHRTPLAVQRFLNALPYNWERPKETLRTYRDVIATGTAHCLEAALAAATILEQHGYPPLLLSLESADDLDHVLFVFQENGRWGTVARSRDAGLHGRKPVFRSVRDLAMTYVEPYVDFTGRLEGYGVGTLYDLGNYDWRFSRKNVWKVERYLIDMPHKKYRMSERHYQRALRRFKAFRARHPDAPVTYYDSRPLWLR